MKHLRSLFFVVLFFAACTDAHAQWQTPNRSVPIGRGVGETGFGSATPGTAGLPLVSNNPVTSDPSFQLLGIVGGGTNASTQQAALNNIMPASPTAGSITYFNGTNWVSFAGNTSGTQILTENASGVPSWAASGSVSSVTCGTGLSGGTITTTGTCAVSLSTVVNSLGADVALNNTATYFDGPSAAQGTTGTWFASGTVTLLDTAATASFQCKLWDGTTVIASSQQNSTGANALANIALSGVLATPAANIRISCKDLSATTGVLKFNSSGNSKDSTVTVMRIN